MIRAINSHSEMLENFEENKKAYVFLYKSGSEKSDCALENLKQIATDADNTVMLADVNQVRDIHANYQVSTVPSLLEFDGKTYKNIIKGCQSSTYYKSLFEQSMYVAAQKTEGKLRKNVVVYSTPTCVHCNNIKKYFRDNSIQFRDVDVSKDQKQAEAMVKKSGQQGVPQTEINGQLVVGFDKKRIDQLLDIKAN